MDRDVLGGADEAPLMLTRVPERVNSSALQLANAQSLLRNRRYRDAEERIHKKSSIR